jgi:hypothetical protein
MSEFGFSDWEPADSYSPDREIDPLAFARRLHEDRAAIAVLAGQPVPRWAALDDEEREVAVGMARALIEWLRTEGTID